MSKILDIPERFLNLLLIKGFCPTGQGGGIDNSCGGAGGGGGVNESRAYVSGSWAKEDPKTRMPLDKMESIAKKHLFLDDLKERHSGDDFSEIGVAGARAGLHAAYEAGGGKSSIGKMMKKYEKIAKEEFFMDTLESRNMDSLDFTETSVVSVRDALNKAYKLGKGT